jgi:hypothetical protein
MIYKCSKCKEYKEDSEFNRNASRGRRGLSNYCRICQKAHQKEYYESHAKEVYDKKQMRKIKAKEDGIQAYGGRCVCCGENEIKFLTIDHINNQTGEDGEKNKHGTRKYVGKTLWVKLKRLGWPTDNYQLLCFSCNAAKYYYGICPHQTKYNLEIGTEAH